MLQARSKKLEKRLRAVWDATTTRLGAPAAGGTSNRYMAKALGSGFGWGVYDQRERRFLSDAEVTALPFERLLDKELN